MRQLRVTSSLAVPIPAAHYLLTATLVLLWVSPAQADPSMTDSIVPQVDAVEALDLTLDLPSSEAPPLKEGATRESTLFEEIPSVLGAAKYDQKVNEAPAAVIIITADQIKKYGYRNFAQILDSVPACLPTTIAIMATLAFEGSIGRATIPHAFCCWSTTTGSMMPSTIRAEPARKCP